MSKIIIYDFDGTLTKNSIPKYPILKNKHLKIKIETLFNYLLKYENGIYNSFYEMYFKQINNMGLPFNDDTFCYGAFDVKFRDGVLEYFEETKDDDTKHFIVTSGYAPFVERTKIGKFIEKVFGTTYEFDGDNFIGIKNLMDNKKKVNAIKEISYYYDGDIIYIGDGLTDIYAFNCVKEEGGKCVLLRKNKFNSLTNETLLLSGVIDHYVDADFSKNSDLYKYIKK